jgi:hypothetical protein
MVQKKINVLHTPCRRVLRKLADSKKSGTGPDHLYIPSLWYCDDKNFLRDHKIQLKGISAVDQVAGTQDEEDAMVSQCLKIFI